LLIITENSTLFCLKTHSNIDILILIEIKVLFRRQVKYYLS
jgi:hypothetical protein